MLRLFCLAVSTNVYRTPFAKAPLWVSAKSHALRAVANGRMCVSQRLLEMSRRPSSRNISR